MSAIPKSIDTARTSATLRARAIDLANRKILVSKLSGSEQVGDLKVPPNCQGFGRVRHFKQSTSPGWPLSPLPIVPACRALGLAAPPMMTAQVFQNAACAWRCWYCFVPYNLLAANPKRSEWFSAEQLVELYAQEKDRPLIIDLSGGSPDLVPEWTVWMMEALDAAGLAETTFLWTDDNLSTHYLFENLTKEQLARVCSYRNYGRVCCFKGFDATSFAFNTHAAESDFDGQFAVMQRLLGLGLDVYGYITLTGPTMDGLSSKMEELFDRLRTLDPNLPLRIIPLEIREFAPVLSRMNDARRFSIEVQDRAIREWNTNITRRYDEKARALDIASVPLQTRSARAS